VKGLSFHDVADTFRRFRLPSAETIAAAEWPQSLALDENPDNDGPRLHKGCLVMAGSDGGVPPILAQKHYAQPSAFTPENLLREARRQKRITGSRIPDICVLDPDGDIVRSLLADGEARLEAGWACYHTQLYSFSRGGIEFGIVGCAVGASFAVLIAEEMFASGCKLLISVTSSGQILPIRSPPYFIIIERALRDEGTSYHYIAPSEYSHADAGLISALDGAFGAFSVPVLTGATWTTDAPFRETQPAIDAMCKRKLLAVEMEAAALYAFAQVRQKPVLCFAHVTNQMGRVDGDFEKGEADGSRDAMQLIAIAADRLRSRLLL
jgi:uridine phosphorylase